MGRMQVHDLLTTGVTCILRPPSDLMIHGPSDCNMRSRKKLGMTPPNVLKGWILKTQVSH